MDLFDLPLTQELGDMDPEGGVLVLTSYWRPRLRDPDPDHPGEKLTIMSYLPTQAQEPCPCGSGKRFEECCQPLPYWRPVCPNPGMQGYGLVVPQAARWRQVQGVEVRTRLEEDVRLYEVQTTWQGGFWIYWGDPAYDAPYGTLCFGDLELKRRHSLLVTALPRAAHDYLAGALEPSGAGAATPPARPRAAGEQTAQARFTPHPTAQGLKRTYGSQPEQDGGNEDHRQVVHRPFFVAGGHAAELF
jgi:hypothetical protein